MSNLGGETPFEQAVELRAYGVGVNAVAPGPVETPGASTVVDAAGLDARRACTPLKRLATTEEVAAGVVFLVSDAAASITVAGP